MKFYAILLGLLFVAVGLNNIWLLIAGQPPLYGLLYALEVVAFGCCLAGAFARAFNRRFFTPDVWRLVWYLTLALGVASIGFRAFGSYWGFVAATPVNAVDLGMAALRYGLFAVPVMLYEQSLRGEEKA